MERKGINGYSLQGPSGYTGENGKNIFFCAYGINSHNDDEQEHGENEDLVNDLISQNKALSDNKNINETIYYNDGDIILDSNGDLYKIENGVIVFFESIFDDMVSDGGSEIAIDAEWEIIDSSVQISNYYNYKSVDDSEKSPFYIHRDSFETAIPAHNLSIEVECDDIEIINIKITTVIDGCIEKVVSEDYPVPEDLGNGRKKYKITFAVEKRYFTSSPRMKFKNGGTMPADDDYDIEYVDDDSLPSERISIFVDLYGTDPVLGKVMYSVEALPKTQSNQNE